MSQYKDKATIVKRMLECYDLFGRVGKKDGHKFEYYPLEKNTYLPTNYEILVLRYGLDQLKERTAPKVEVAVVEPEINADMPRGEPIIKLGDDLGSIPMESVTIVEPEINAGNIPRGEPKVEIEKEILIEPELRVMETIEPSPQPQPTPKKIIYYCLKKGHECFEDYIDSLNIIDKRVYYTNDSELDQSLFADPVNVHIFRYHLPKFLDNTKSPGVYVLNTEQMTEPVRHAHILRIAKMGIPIIDYSVTNMEILKDYRVIYLPYQPIDTETRALKRFSARPVHDVGVVNCQTPRRKRVLKMLQQSGIKAVDIRGWKEHRDAKIGACKILLNLHFSDGFRVFEHMRCDRWLFAGKPVVSERCDSENKIDLGDCVTFTDDNLVRAVRTALLRSQAPRVSDEVLHLRRQCLEQFKKGLKNI
jgi:hypothetical protein